MSVDSPLGSTLGVVGGGQLGRMLAEAAAPLGVEIIVLDPTPDAPAAPVSRDQIVAAFDDTAAIDRLAQKADVLTYEIELADPDVLEAIAKKTGTPVEPAPDTLRMIQDKYTQKRALAEAGIPVPAVSSVDTTHALRAACEELGYPAMLKARSGGYDGRGNTPIASPDDLERAWAEISGPAMVEAFVDFAREISVIGVKGTDERRCYVPAENVHEDEILRESIVPARIAPAVKEQALRVAHDVLDQVEGRGVYGIELFETHDGEILVNEIAPRPHNSGHWTIEGAVTSQFEQHVRAVLGLPLGSTAVRCPIVTKNILGDTGTTQPASPTGITPLLESNDVHLHWYGKQDVRPLRKMGHIAVYGEEDQTVDALLKTARTYASDITFDTNEV